MKNPLEMSLLEIEALFADDENAPHRAFNDLLIYVRDRQKYMRSYEVAKITEEIKTKKTDVSKRQLRSLDEELLDNCEIVTLEQSA